MWGFHIEDLLRRPRRDKFVEHFAAVMLGVFDLAVELAIGKGARPALAELHIGFAVEHPFAP